MDLNLKGRTALVSGASTGIGAGVARALAREGTAITARRHDRLEHLALQIASARAEMPIIVTGDLTDADDVLSVSLMRRPPRSAPLRFWSIVPEGATRQRRMPRMPTGMKPLL